MASTFKNLGLFNSGPHRFALKPQGLSVIPAWHLNPGAPGTAILGPLELAVVVTGRLVAASEAALWTLRDAITAQLTNPPQVGTLIDHHGRQWTNMSFILFAEDDRTDRARAVSIAYTATFLRFLNP